MVSIKFKTIGATSAGGSFGPGDIMRCDEKLARHLVEEAQCAVYLQAPQPVQAPAVESDAEQTQVRRARRSSKD